MHKQVKTFRKISMYTFSLRIVRSYNAKFITSYIKFHQHNITRYKHGSPSLIKTAQGESILRNELGLVRGEKRRKAGKKDKG